MYWSTGAQYLQRLLVGRRRRVGRGEAELVPGAVDERVHGVGLAHGVGTALGTFHVLPGRVMVERVARPVEGDVVRQLDG